MRIRAGLFVASLAGLLPLPVAATQFRDDEIVVTGEAPGDIQRQTRSYVTELGIALGETPTARWFDPICPRAAGLNRAHAAIVEDRVRQVVRQVGAPLAKANCTPNVVIVFTDGPNPVIGRIDRKSAALNEVAPRKVRELKEGKAPIRWWYNTEVRSRDATGLDPLDNAMGRPTLHVPNSSMISTQTVRAIITATVIVDVEASHGKALKSVVDYAALVALAEVRQAASPRGSILSLFGEPAPARQLTPRDTNFLKGLYRIHMDRRAEQQHRTLIGQMIRGSSAN